MAVREIRLFGDPVLKTQSDLVSSITPSIQTLVEDLEETTALPGRAGVAAPQIGVNLKVFSYNVDGVIAHLINPQILEYLGEQVPMQEGCLSLPELWASTPRYPSVRVCGEKVTGEKVEFVATGFLAQVMQHEIDHLDGLVYVDRLDAPARKEAMAALRATDWFMR
jgi:peptide deformylase